MHVSLNHKADPISRLLQHGGVEHADRAAADGSTIVEDCNRRREKEAILLQRSRLPDLYGDKKGLSVSVPWSGGLIVQPNVVVVHITQDAIARGF